MFKNKTIIQLGDCEFDTISYALWRNRQRVTPELTASEAKLLIYLYENSTRVISRAELLDHVASERVVDDAIITQYIKTVRKALGDPARNPKYIRTYQKEGYQFIAAVKRSGESKKFYWVYLLALMLVVISLVTFQYILPNSDNNTYQTPYPLTSLKGHELFGAASPDSRYIVFSHKALNATANWQLVIKSLEQERYYQLTVEQANHLQAKFSQNGNYLLYHVFSSDVNEIRLAEINWQTYQLENIKSIKKFPAGLYTVYLAWNDDNSFYYASKPERLSPVSIKRYNIEQQTEEIITQPPTNGAGDLALSYSPDQKKLAFLRNVAYSKSEVYTYDEITKTLNQHYTLPIEPLSLEWDTGERLIIRDKETSLSLLDTRTNEITQILSSRYPVYAPFFISENMIGFTQGDFIISDIEQSYLDSSSEPEPFISSSFNDYRPSYSQETKSLAFLSNRTGLDQIWIKELSGNLRQITTFDEAKKIQHIALSPNGKLIAFTSNATIFLLDSFTGDLLSEIAGDDKSYIDPVFSQNSDYLYFTLKHGDEWFIERRVLSNLSLETILTKGFLVKPCATSGCYYYLRLSDKMLMKRTGLDAEVSTGVKLENVGFASQFEILGNSVFYTLKQNGTVTLYKHIIGNADREKVKAVNSIHFTINTDNKRVYFSTRRANDTNIEAVQTKK